MPDFLLADFWSQWRQTMGRDPTVVVLPNGSRITYLGSVPGQQFRVAGSVSTGAKTETFALELET